MDLVCRQANCNDAFVGITEKIVDQIEGGSDPGFSVKEVVSEFKEMLKSISSANLSRMEIIGLLGELYLLRKVVQINPAGLKNWSDPLGSLKTLLQWSGDRGEKQCCERSLGENFIPRTASNPRQFGSPPCDVSFDENPQGESILPILIKEIEGLGVDLDLFESRLAMVGYHREKRNITRSFSFCFRGRNCFIWLMMNFQN